MRKFIAGFLGIASLFVASTVFAVGTSTVRYHQIEVGTLNLGTPTAVTIAKVPVMTDNTGSKLDSGGLSLVSGSQTVTTSLTAVDAVFYSFNLTTVGSVTSFRHSISGAGFTVYGYDPVTGATSTSSYTGDWLAIDE